MYIFPKKVRANLLVAPALQGRGRLGEGTGMDRLRAAARKIMIDMRRDLRGRNDRTWLGRGWNVSHPYGHLRGNGDHPMNVDHHRIEHQLHVYA